MIILTSESSQGWPLLIVFSLENWSYCPLFFLCVDINFRLYPEYHGHSAVEALGSVRVI